MPQYKVTAPDGYVYKIDGPEGVPESALLQYATQLHEQRMAEQAKQASGSDFVRGVKSYLPQTKSILGGAETLLGKAVGSEDITKAGINRIQEAQAAQEQTSKPTDSFANAWEKGIGTVLTDWLPYQAGIGVSNTLETLAAATAGSMVGSAVPVIGTGAGAVAGVLEKSLIKKGIKEAAEKIIKSRGEEAGQAFIETEAKKALAGDVARQYAKSGAKIFGSNAGIATTAAVHGAGEVTDRAVEEAIARGENPENIDMSRVAPAAALHGLTDFVADKIGLAGLSGKLTTGGKSLITDIAKSIGVTGALEVPPEVVQTALERYGAQLSLTEKDALKDYFETAAASFGMATVPGGFGGVRAHAINQQNLAEQKAQQEQQAQAAQVQAQREAAGVMDQQPLLTPEEAPVIERPEVVGPPATPIPEPTTTMPTEFGFNEKNEYVETPKPVQDITYSTKGKDAEYSAYGKPIVPTAAPEAVPAGQGDLFTARGRPTPDALASVETARLQGLPAQIQEMNQTPEGRKELAANMKVYFPELNTIERNKLRKVIQAGTYGVEPTPEPVAPKGTLTPDVLKTFGITKRNKSLFNALVDSNIANPMTRHFLITAAERGDVNVNRIIDAYQLAGAKNEQAKQNQQALFDVQENGVPNNVEPAGVEQGVGLPVQPEEAPVEETQEPDGTGMGLPVGPADGRTDLAGQGVAEQPSTLTAKELKAQEREQKRITKEQVKAQRLALEAQAKEQKRANAALKNEDVADAWSYLSDIPFDQLSDEAQTLVRDAHTPFGKEKPYLTQDYADRIEALESKNKRIEAANKRVKPEKILAETNQAIEPKAVTMTEAKLVEAEVSGKTPIEVADWIANNSPNKSYRIIAERVADQLKKMQALGIRQTFKVVHIGDNAPMKLHPQGVLGLSEYKFTPGSSGVSVYVKGTDLVDANGGNVGTTVRTVLHELVHAATQGAIHFGMLKVSEGTKFSDDARRLNAVRNAVMDHINARIADAKVGRTQLTKFEQDAIDGNNNAFANISEMVTWALTDPDMQAYLESIPYKNNQSLWSEFVTAIRTLLGIPATADTALSEVLSVSEDLLAADLTDVKQKAESIGYALHIDPQAQAQAQQLNKAMSGTLAQNLRTPVPTASQVAKDIGAQMMKNPTGAFKMFEDMIDKFRVKVVDKNAATATLIQDMHGNAFRDVNQMVRADLLASQANNVTNLTDATFAFGDIGITADGMLQVKDGKYSIENVFKASRKLADRIGVDEMRKLVTNAFYHDRAAVFKAMPKDQWPENWQADPRMVPTDAQIKAGQDAFNQYPELREMREQFIGTKNQMVKFLHDAGFLSDEKAKAFLADNAYAPWMRLKDYQDKASGLGNSGRMVNLSQMKAIVGGTEEVNDMLENMAQMIGWCVRSGTMNYTANRELEELATAGVAQRHKGRPSGNPAHIVMTYEAGKPVYWTVDNPLHLATFQTIKSMNSPAVREVAKWMGRLRASIVLFPAFPVKQVIVDSQRAFMQSGVENPWSMVGKIYKSFLTGEASKGTHQDIEDLKKFGVVGEVDFNTHDTTRGRAAKYGLNAPAESITDKWVNSPAYKFLHNLAYSADLAVRLGIYRQTLEETGDKTLAATRAREIINFQKQGSSEAMQLAKQLIPFLGAYAQGMDVNYRSMIGRGNSMKERKAAAAAYWSNMAVYAGLVTAYTMMMSGDDDYEQQKGYITDRNFLIPGTSFMLPAPPDVGFLGKVIPERITDYLLQEATDDPESAKRLRQGILEAAATGFMPPAAVYGVTPYVELKLNRSFFSDMPIVGQRYQQLEPAMQFSPNTSEFAKSVGAALNESPLQIDYLLKAIGGTTAGSILQMADVVMGNNKMEPEKLPIIGGFQRNTVGGRYQEEYYATRQLADQAYETATALAESGDIEKYNEYIARPEIQARINARPGIESIHTALSAVSKQRNAIMAQPDLTPEEKRQAVNELMMNVERSLKSMQIRKLRSSLE